MPATLPASSGLTPCTVLLPKMSSLAKCRVCGKEYKPCRSVVSNGVFRWQAVACSPECGAKYLARIEESRAPKKAESKAHRTRKSSVPIFIDDLEGSQSEETVE